MSLASFRRWSRVPALIRPILESFDLCLAQDELQAERFKRLGARQAITVGDLKTAAAPLPVDAAELARLEAALGKRPRWLAASTHEGEEEVVAEAHRILKRRFPDLVTIIAPRHPSRGEAIAALLQERGLKVARRARGEPAGAADIYIADTLGELGLFYRLGGIAFVGGSLSDIGGHNPLEAALLDCAILHGPDMANCAAIAEALRAAGAAETVIDAASLAEAVGRLLRAPELRRSRIAAGEGVAAKQRHVLDTVLDRLAPFLDRIESDAARPA